MCFGENGSDTLQDEEQAKLRQAAQSHLPTYEFTLHSNDDAITWAVLEPPPSGLRMPKFTVCRIDPCIMVMVEGHGIDRRFSSMANVEDAITFASHAAHSAVLALHNVHAAPELAQ